MSGSLKTKMLVPQKRVAELIATTLPQVNWQISNFNEEMKTCTAHQQIDKGGGAGQPDIYNYTAVLEWGAITDEVDTYHIRVSVSEKNNKVSETECKTLCAEFFRRCKNLLQRLVDNPLTEKLAYGSSRWAEIEELRTAGWILPENDLPAKSFLVGPNGDDEIIAVPPELSVRHSIVCGATGTGKTTGFILPQVIRRLDISAIITEATDGSKAPAIYSQSARWRAEKGKQDIYYFNPDDLTSNQINLVAHIKTAENAAVIADLIIRNTSAKLGATDDFWPQAEKYLLNALLIHVAGYKGNLSEVRRLIQKGAKALGEELSESVYQRARDEYGGFLNTGSETTRSNVFIGLLNRLTPWTYATVQKVTERTDFDVYGLRERLFTFYIAVPAGKNDLKPVVALVLNFILEEVMQVKTETAQGSSPLKYPVTLILDEFTNFGRIAGFDEKISIIRHRGIGVTLGFQAMDKFWDTYGREVANTIMANLGTRIFLRPNDYETADLVSKQLGQKTHYERKINSTGNIVETEVGVPLMAPAEVMRLDLSKAILFTPSTAPLKIPFYQWADHQEAYTMPPWERRKLVAEAELVKAADIEGTAVESTGERNRSRDTHDQLHDERAPDF